jgi:electron transport complex protein RnfC
LQPLENFDEVDPSVLRAAINDAGFTGLSAISPDPSHWPPVKVLVISAFDQDPLSIANQQAFRDHLHQVGTGIHLLARATEASRTVLAVPKNLAEMAADISLNGAAIAVLPPVYPNGLPEILAKKCGAGFLMKGSEVGVTGNTLVVSVETAVAMATSLQTGRPLLEKTVTFSAGRGGPLKNLRVRIGTPIAHILKHQGVTLGSKGKLILNGMMRGYACFSDEQPITATTESVHVQTPSEVFSFQNTACINCGKCAAICPVDLEAGLLGRLSEYGIFEKCKRLGAENCIECGLCAYICPGHRPLVQLISHAKQRIHPPAVQHISLEEGLVCDKCGPACVTIGLFESESKREEDGREE